MPIPLHCPCGKRLRAPEKLVGRKVKCPGCQQLLLVPDDQDEALDEIAVTETGEPVSEAFLRKLKVQWSVAVVGLVAMFLMIFTNLANRGNLFDRILRLFGIADYVLFIISVSLIVVVAIVTLVNWRCPMCKKYLGRSIFIDACPKCQVSLKMH